MEKYKKKYLGIIEDVNDPLHKGGAKIRIPELHKDIDVDDLPWTYPKSTTIFGKDGLGANISIPREKSLVEVQYNNENKYSSEYTVIQELSQDLKDFLQNDDNYKDAHIFIYDGQEDLKIYYIVKEGYVIDNKESTITVFNDNRIEIKHKDKKSIIELDGGTIRETADSSINNSAGSRIKNTSEEVWENGDLVKLGTTPQYSVVLGEPLFLLLSTMATVIDAKYSPTPSVMTTAVNQFKSMVLSKNVKTSA